MYTWRCRGCGCICHRSVPVCPRCGVEVRAIDWSVTEE